MTQNNSGVPFRIFNTLERASSADLNDAQTFGSRALMEMMRGTYGRRRIGSGATLSTGSMMIESVAATQTDAVTLQAIVLGGLLVNPQGTQMLIDGGSLVAVFPAAIPSADDSAMVVANSDGVATGLSFTPPVNKRWDLVECRPTTTVTTGTRDIFNTTTRSFTGQSVPLLSTTTLEFRIRLGSDLALNPGPTLVAGWLPIAAIYAPPGSTTFDQCEIYDVRPLMSDLSQAGETGSRRAVGTDDVKFDVVLISSGPGTATNYLDGSIYRQNAGFGTDPAGSVASGDPISWAKPYTISGLIPNTGIGNALSSRVNLMQGISGIASVGKFMPAAINYQEDNWYSLNLVYPFNLPRWCRFGTVSEQVGGRRWPAACGGILSMSDGAADAGMYAACSLPSEFGTGAGVFYPSICLGFITSVFDFGTNGAAFVPCVRGTDGWTHFALGLNDAHVGFSTTSAKSVTGTVGGTLATFSLPRVGGSVFMPYGPIDMFRVSANLNMASGNHIRASMAVLSPSNNYLGGADVLSYCNPPVSAFTGSSDPSHFTMFDFLCPVHATTPTMTAKVQTYTNAMTGAGVKLASFRIGLGAQRV